MESKTAFIFLAFCIIAAIDSGYSLQCYITCSLPYSGCEGSGTGVTTCESNEHQCVTNIMGKNETQYHCLYDGWTSNCTKRPNECTMCTTPKCNTPKTKTDDGKNNTKPEDGKNNTKPDDGE